MLNEETSCGEAIRRLVHPRSDRRAQLQRDGDGGGKEDRVESKQRQSGKEIDPGGRLAIRGEGGGVVAGATYRKREVEDEDEEAVHGAADVDAGCCGGGGGARRLAEVPSHTQNGPSPVTPAPAIPSSGATPPSPDG